MHTEAKLGQSQTFLRWSRLRRPLLLEPADGPYCVSANELRQVARYRLGNIAAHGFLDMEKRRGSYFNLFGLPAQTGLRHSAFLELLAPALHQAADRMLAKPTGAMD